MVTTKLEFGAPILVASGMAGGKWKIPGTGTPGYSFGDGQIWRDEFHGLYRFAMRIGGTTGGCGYAEKPLDGKPWDWSSVTMPGGPEDPEKAFPTGLNNVNATNVDAITGWTNPNTGVVTVCHTANPGNISEAHQGKVNGIQRRTSKAPHKGSALSFADSWNHFGADFVAEFEGAFSPYPTWTGAAWHVPRVTSVGPPLVLDGGADECSIWPDFANSRVLVAYEAKSTGSTQWGTGWKNRIGFRSAPIAGFDTSPTFSYLPTLTDTSWSWDVEDDPAFVTQASEQPTTWGTMPGLTPRSGFSIADDGVWWLAIIAQKPAATANPRNQSTAIGLWYSLDEGATWVQMEGNPIVVPSLFGLSVLNSGNWVNSPFLIHEPGVVWLGFWANHQGNDVINDPSTELYMMSASVEAGHGGFSPRLYVADDELDTIFGKSMLWEETQHGMRRR